jgi:hypothetical protein
LKSTRKSNRTETCFDLESRGKSEIDLMASFEMAEQRERERKKLPQAAAEGWRRIRRGFAYAESPTPVL